MPPRLDVDTDVYASVGRAFLAVNASTCDAVTALATAANGAAGMAGVDSSGATWARSYDAAAAALLRADAAVVEALGVVGDRLTAGAANHYDAEVASAGAGPPAYPGQPGTTRAVDVVVSAPPSADGTPDDPPAGWFLVAGSLAVVWPAGHPEQLREVGRGWLSAHFLLADEADRLSGPIADLAGQISPEIPYAVDVATGLRSTLRDLADEHATVAQACTGYADAIAKAHHDVIAELVELVAFEAVVEIAGAIAAAPSGGTAEVPAQAVAASRLSVAAARITEFLETLAEEVLTFETLVAGVGERLVDTIVELQTVNRNEQTLQAATALVDAGIPPVDLQANEDDNPDAHVIRKHVEKSDEYLKSRTDQPIASTFTSRAAATMAISTLLAASKAEIDAWLRGSKKELRLKGPLPAGAGRSYLRDSDRFIVPTNMRVTLRRNSTGYYIFTAFPEP